MKNGNRDVLNCSLLLDVAIIDDKTSYLVVTKIICLDKESIDFGIVELFAKTYEEALNKFNQIADKNARIRTFKGE